MPSPRFIDRLGRIGLAGVLAAGALIPITAASASASAAPLSGVAAGARAVATSGDLLTLTSKRLEVAVSAAFPQVVGYTDRATDASIAGNPDVLTSLTVNGTAEPVTVTSEQVDEHTVDYTLTPTNLDGVVIEARLSLKGNVVTFAVTGITDPGEVVRTLQVPGQNLVTVSSSDAGASVAVANLSVNRNVSGDAFIPVTPTTPLDASAKSSNAIIVNTGELAAAFATNSLYDTSSGPGNKDSGNFWRQAVSDGAGGVEVGVSSGQWL
ncbi:MAG TPA: endo-alpha-N-acetylgalactosaminidase, partial [Agromyces sp.]